MTQLWNWIDNLDGGALMAGLFLVCILLEYIGRRYKDEHGKRLERTRKGLRGPEASRDQ